MREGKSRQRQLVTSLARQTGVRGKKDAHLPIVTSGPAGAEGGCVCVVGRAARKQAGKLSVCLSVWVVGQGWH